MTQLTDKQRKLLEFEKETHKLWITTFLAIIPITIIFWATVLFLSDLEKSYYAFYGIVGNILVLAVILAYFFYRFYATGLRLVKNG